MRLVSLLALLILLVNINLAVDTPHWYQDWHTAIGKDLKNYQRKYALNKKVFEDLENHYKKCNPHYIEKRNTIPKILHAIWVGPKPIPALFHRCQKIWQEEFSGWEYILWTNEKVEQEMIPLFSDEHRAIYFNGNKDHREKADVLRLYLLKYYGGFYIDGDMICLNSKAFQDMAAYYDFVVGISGHTNPEIFNNAIIGSTPNHPIINYLLDNLKNIPIKDWKYRSGVFFFSRTLNKIFLTSDGMNIAFPTTVFYAAPYKFDQPIEKYIRPWSLTVHYWANGHWKSNSD